MIIVDAYPFLTFPNLPCHLENTGIGVFWFTAASDSKENNVGRSNQEASP